MFCCTYLHLKLNISNITLTECTPSHDHRFLQALSHFVGSSPSWGDFFFLKSYTKWSFFIYSNILESHVINLRGQDNLKTQKIVQEIREIVIAIYLCNIHFYPLINYIFFYQVSMVCWLARWASDLKVVSSSLGLGERFYSFFFQNETKSEEICDHERGCILSE